MENQIRQILNSANNAAKDEKLLNLLEQIQKNLTDGIEKLQKNQEKISISLNSASCRLNDNETLIKIQENQQFLPQIVLDEEELSVVEKKKATAPTLAEYVFDSVKNGLSTINRKKIPIEMRSDVDNSVYRIFEDINPYLVRDLPPLIGTDEFHTGNYGKLTKSVVNQDLKDVVIELPPIPVVLTKDEPKIDSANAIPAEVETKSQNSEKKVINDVTIPAQTLPNDITTPASPLLTDVIIPPPPNIKNMTIQQQLNQEIQNAVLSSKNNVSASPPSPSIKSTASSADSEDIFEKIPVPKMRIPVHPPNSSANQSSSLIQQSEPLENPLSSDIEKSVVPPLPAKSRTVGAPKVPQRRIQPTNVNQTLPVKSSVVEKPKIPERKNSQVTTTNESKPSNESTAKPLPATRSKPSVVQPPYLSPTNKNAKVKSLFSSSDEAESDDNQSINNPDMVNGIKNHQISVNIIIPLPSPVSSPGTKQPSPQTSNMAPVQSLFLDDDLDLDDVLKNSEFISKVPSRNTSQQLQEKISLFGDESDHTVVPKANETNSNIPATTTRISRKLFDDSDSDDDDDFFVPSKALPKSQEPRKPEEIKPNIAKNIIQKPVNQNVRKSMFSSSESD